ncbi:MAG: transcriptional regulator, partial [Candidatus Atribacteria bacterium]|nr:transcriptional regulator [Candidatus Atribacteria bacterium]
LEHIAVHRYFMGLDLQRDISDEEAVAHWYDKVYNPIINNIRRSGILKEFSGKTEGDLYLWVLDRQRYLHAEGQKLVSPQKAAKDFLEEVK